MIAIAHQSLQPFAAATVEPQTGENIEIVAEAGIDAGLLDVLCRAVSETMSVPCHVADRALHTEGAYNPARGQYSAEAILRQLTPAPYCRVLGVVDADLYVPPLAHVVGLAHPDRRRALIGLPRLRDGGDESLDQEAAFRARVVGEALHQLSRTCRLDPDDYVRDVNALVEDSWRDASGN